LGVNPPTDLLDGGSQTEQSTFRYYSTRKLNKEKRKERRGRRGKREVEGMHLFVPGHERTPSALPVFKVIKTRNLPRAVTRTVSGVLARTTRWRPFRTIMMMRVR
jgi:hypothetical protein